MGEARLHVVILHALFDLKPEFPKGTSRRHSKISPCGICKRKATSSIGDGCAKLFRRDQRFRGRRKRTSLSSSSWMSRPTSVVMSTWQKT